MKKLLVVAICALLISEAWGAASAPPKSELEMGPGVGVTVADLRVRERARIKINSNPKRFDRISITKPSPSGGRKNSIFSELCPVAKNCLNGPIAQTPLRDMFLAPST